MKIKKHNETPAVVIQILASILLTLYMILKSINGNIGFENGIAYVYPVNFTEENIERKYVILGNKDAHQYPEGLENISQFELRKKMGQKYIVRENLNIYKYDGYEIEEYAIIENSETHILQLGKYVEDGQDE